MCPVSEGDIPDNFCDIEQPLLYTNIRGMDDNTVANQTLQPRLVLQNRGNTVPLAAVGGGLVVMDSRI